MRVHTLQLREQVRGVCPLLSCWQRFESTAALHRKPALSSLGPGALLIQSVTVKGTEQPKTSARIICINWIALVIIFPLLHVRIYISSCLLTHISTLLLNAIRISYYSDISVSRC